MAHRNRWFTVLKHGDFRVRYVKLPEGKVGLESVTGSLLQKKWRQLHVAVGWITA